MGSGATKDAPVVVEMTSSCCFNRSGMMHENRAMLKSQDTSTDDNYAVTDRKVKLSKRERMTIQTEGAGVFQIGLIRQSVGDSRKWSESPDFVIEDGSQEGTSAREIYVDAGYLYYGNKGEATEVKEWEGHVEEAWLFIVVLYGKPKFRLFKVSLTGRETPELWSNQCGANMSVAMDTMTSPHRTSDAVLCATEQLKVNETYNIHWDMCLDLAVSRSTEFGFFRFGFVTSTPDESRLREMSLFNDGAIRKQDTWFVSSAVRNYPYSGVMSFRVSGEGEVTHNVLVESVNNTTTFTLPPNFRGPLYLVVELFFGELTIHRLTKSAVKQGLGGTLLIQNYGEDKSSVTDLIVDLTNVFGHKPARIQYGYSPRNFASEFACQMPDSSIKRAKKDIAYSIVSRIEETKTVQLLNVSSDLSENDLRLFFEHQGASGGGLLLDIQQDEFIGSCWLLTFEDIEAARRVWRAKTHCIKHCRIQVLPFFPELGLATNGGNKPEFGEPSLTLEGLDSLKLRYIKAKRQQHFENFLSNLATVEFLIEETDEDDEVNEDGEEIKGVKLDCAEACKSNDRRRAVWKEEAINRIEDFMDGVYVEKLGISCTQKQLNDTLEKFTSIDVLFIIDHEEKHLTLVTTDKNVLNQVSNAIPKGRRNEASFRIECDQELTFPYNVLEFENRIHPIQTANRNTSFGNEAGVIVIEGPEEEVHAAYGAILELAVDVRKRDLTASSHKLTFISTEAGFRYIQRLVNKKVHMYFEVGEKSIAFGSHRAAPGDLDKMFHELQRCMEVIMTEIVQLKEEARPLRNTSKERRFLNRIIGTSEDLLIVEEMEDSIALVGIKDHVQKAKRAINDFYQLHGNHCLQLRISITVAQFLHDHHRGKIAKGGAEVLFEELRFGDDEEDAFLSGRISITGSEEDAKSTEKALMEMARKVGMFWLKFDKPWLAVHASEINLHALQSKYMCSLLLETGSTLAENGIASVAMAKNGALLRVMRCSITDLDVDAIVNATDGQISLKSGLAAIITEKGGRELLAQDCRQHIAKHDALKPGEVMSCTSGRLPARSVINGCCPVWKDNGNREISQLKTLVTNALHLAAKQGHLSVSVPALGSDDFGFPVNEATTAITEAVRDFLQNYNSQTSVREIYLCGTQEDVDAFSEALDAILSPSWFVYRHGIALPTVSEQGTKKKTVAFGATVRPLPVKNNDSIFWGGTLYPRVPSARSRRKPSTQTGSSRRGEDGLPFHRVFGGTTMISITTGCLEDQEVDCIVSFTPEFPRLFGAIPKALLERGGPSIQRECDRLGQLQCGNVAVTSAGRLRCKKLYHVRNQSHWDSTRGYQAVYQMVFDCLSKAMSDGFTSIAFPAVGTGKANYPADDVAAAMLAAVENFLKDNRAGLTEIVFVLYPTDVKTCTAFTNCVRHFIQSPDELGASNPSAGNHDRNGGRDPDGENAKIRRRQKRVTYGDKSSSQHSRADDIALVMVVTDQFKLAGKIEDACRAELEKLYITHSIHIDQMEMKISTSHEQRIQQVASKLQVQIAVDHSVGEVRVTGPRHEVNNAVYELQDLIFRAFQSEHDQETADTMLSRIVEWQMKIDGKHVKMSSKAVLTLEKAFHGATNCQFEHDGKPFEANFRTMKANPTGNTSKKHELRRMWLQSKGVALPSNWTIASTGQETTRVFLGPNSVEFNEVKKDFVRGFNGFQGVPKPKSVLQIYRIENRTLCLQYETKKQELEKQNPKDHRNEMYLWHGTSQESVELINMHGFNRAFSGAHAAVHGDGVYFASDSGYSGQDRFASEDANKVRRMYRAHVLVGQSTQGAQNMRVLPVRQGATKFDSAVDDLGNPNIFVIFHDAQTYPTYLIEYKTK